MNEALFHVSKMLLVCALFLGVQTVCGDGSFESYGACPKCDAIRHRLPCEHCGGGSSSSSGSSGSSSYTPPPVDYDAIRRQREVVAAARAEQERIRQERIAREAEEKAQKERIKAAEEALKMWEKEDAVALAPKKKSGGLSPLLKKSQKLPCAFCENGWRDCPWCEGAKVQCSRSGCMNGQEIC